MTPPTPYLADPDVTLWHGDAVDVLRGMADGTVDCVVTSPPYWGLRDYGTGAWEGGDEECDHSVGGQVQDTKAPGAITTGQRPGVDASTCRKCGARRVDAQLGLEPTPDAYVARLVEVFREVRRVLCPHGTCWVNLGDSYASSGPRGDTRTGFNERYFGSGSPGKQAATAAEVPASTVSDGLKPKDLVGIPWRVAFALQADGWWLRSDIVWAKPNPMPESVTDRPTKSHEYVFLLTKAPRYFFDQEAVREPAEWARWGDQTVPKHEGTATAAGWIGPKSKGELQQRRTPTWEERKAAGAQRGNLALDGNVGAGTQRAVHGDGLSHDLGDPARGRNVRSVWTIATQPYPEAHFATYPEELVRRCVLAGSPERVCRACGEPSVRLVEKPDFSKQPKRNSERWDFRNGDRTSAGAAWQKWRDENPDIQLGWSDCGCRSLCGFCKASPDPACEICTPLNNWRPGLVLDPFVGSGTTCLVARNHGRHSVGIDLNETYLELAATRLQQQSLFSEVP